MPEGAPQDFTVTVLSSTVVVLSWLPVLEILQNGIIIQYTVGCNTSDMVSQHIEEILEMTNTRYYSTIDDLLPYTVYECYVFANTTEGSGPSAVGIVRTSEEGIVLCTYYVATHIGTLHYTISVSTLYMVFAKLCLTFVTVFITHHADHHKYIYSS